jgi:hypothetical protein
MEAVMPTTPHTERHTIEPVQLLVAHAWRMPRVAMTIYLAHLRPDLAVTECLPEELPTSAEALRNAVVVCDAPTTSVRAHAKGWLTIPYDGPHVAVAGVGEQSRAFSSDDFDHVLAVLDDLVSGRWRPAADERVAGERTTLRGEGRDGTG